MSGRRVLVADQPELERVRIAVVHDSGDGHRTFAGAAGPVYITEPGEQPPDEAWLLSLPYESADVVIEALVRWRDKAPAPGDALALRRDLDAERGRTDKLIDAVIGLAGPLMQPPAR